MAGVLISGEIWTQRQTLRGDHVKTPAEGSRPHAKERGPGQLLPHRLRGNQPGRHHDPGLLASRVERQ